MPAMLSGGFPPVTGFSLPNGINARGLVRYQETNVSGREPRRWLHRSGSDDVEAR